MRSKQEILIEASKYKTRAEFARNSAAYRDAQRLRILDEVCAHMKPGYKAWSTEDIQKEALRHSNRLDFILNSPAYQAASRRGIIDQVCGHMKSDRTSSKPENVLMARIKETYPSAIKFRDRKVKISGKPHIFGFDIDIYVPESNKGIEFDGSYWHSLEALTKSKSGNSTPWPTKDIKNYHKIKDDYFLSKGIKVLHISEEEWNKDKSSCIRKCLDFLENSQC